MEVKLSKVDKAPRKDMQGYLEISDRIAKGEEVSASELAFAVEVRKADNEKMKGQLALDTKYYVCDRSGVSTLLKETEFDKIAIKCRKANGEEVTGYLPESGAFLAEDAINASLNAAQAIVSDLDSKLVSDDLN